MKVIFEHAPASARDSMRAALDSDSLHRQPDGTPSLSVGSGEGDGLELRYYSTDLNALESASSLRAVRPTGWAFVVRTKEGRAMGAEYSLAHLTEADHMFRFTHLQHGWIPISIITTLDAITAGALRRPGNFVPAILDIHGAGTVSLWFRAEDPKQDYVVPLIHRNMRRPFVLKGQIQKASQLLSLIREQWASRPHLDNSPANIGSRPELMKGQVIQQADFNGRGAAKGVEGVKTDRLKTEEQRRTKRRRK